MGKAISDGVDDGRGMMCDAISLKRLDAIEICSGYFACRGFRLGGWELRQVSQPMA